MCDMMLKVLNIDHSHYYNRLCYFITDLFRFIYWSLILFVVWMKMMRGLNGTGSKKSKLIWIFFL